MKDLIEFKPNTKGIKIETPNGWEVFKGVAKYRPKSIYKITTRSGLTFKASANHSLIDKKGDSLLVGNCKNRIIQTKSGLDKVIAKEKLKNKDFVYDIVDVPCRMFYSNGVLHHNTHLLEEFWSSVIPTISSGKKSKILLVSTPQGVGNKFYEIYSQAEQNLNPPWKAERIDWWEVPGRDQAWKETMIAALGSEEKFLQEFNNCVGGSSQVCISNEGDSKFYKIRDLYDRFKELLSENVAINDKNLKVSTPWGPRSFKGVQRLKKNVLEFTTDRTKIVASLKHPFIVEGELKIADSLNVGDFLEGERGELQQITNIKKIKQKRWVYDLVSVDGSCYYANGVLVHNCFLDDSTSAVGALLIERFKQTKKPAIWTSEEGDYSVFEYPDKNKLYVIGVDVGEGIGRAASVAQILDVTDLQDIKQVAVYGSAVIEPYHFANKLLTIGQSWGVPPILIERNNCGAQVIDALHYHHNYEKIVAYSKISTSDKYNTTRNLGVLSHTNIRSDGIGNMRYWVNHLQCVQINDSQTISEFETFVKHPNGVYKKRTDKFFDDRIMTLTWALFILKTEIAEQYFQIVDFDLQNHPLRIVPNGYWENFTENYDLKDLSKNPSVVPKPAAEENLAYPALGITQKEIETLDKYDLDEDSLLEMGYTYFNQDV